MEINLMPQMLGPGVTSLLSASRLASPILLYLGPETIMPLGSFLAAAVGILLVFWSRVTLMFRSGFRRILGRKPAPAEEPEGPGPSQRSPGAD